MSATGMVRRTRGRDDYQTPPEVFDPLHREFHFMLDAAADAANHKVSRWFGPGGVREDALSVAWVGGNVWLNPPYKKLRPWIEKAEQEAAKHGITVVALLPNNTDAPWFPLLYRTASEIRLVRRRIKFYLDGVQMRSPAGGSMIVIWRGRQPRVGYPHVSLWEWES